MIATCYKLTSSPPFRLCDLLFFSLLVLASPSPVMFVSRLSVFLAIVLALLVNLSLQQTEETMAATTGLKKPWADGPVKLVTTPQYATKKVGVII